MPVVRRIRRDGTTISVEANTEVLFMPGGSVNNWAAKFTAQIRARGARNAPRHNYAERSLRPHPGKHLNQTIISARPRFWSNGSDKTYVYAAVGSNSAYAYYVDQGTGVYAGNGPYLAKVLPPWHQGEGSLYEHTWRPGGPDQARVRPVFIKGQKGQFFFDKTLTETMRHMRLSAFQKPASPKISEAMNHFPLGLEGFLGNTPGGEAFEKRLDLWREWRDERFNPGLVLGRNGGHTSRESDRRRVKAQAAQQARIERSAVARLYRAQASARRSQERRDKIKAANTAEGRDTPRNPSKPRQTASQRAKLQSLKYMASWQANPQHKGFKIATAPMPWGFSYTDRGGTIHKVYWPIYLADLWAESGAKHWAAPKDG